MQVPGSASPSAQRQCDRLRDKGNEVFSDSISAALPPCIRRSRLQKACALYSEALACSVSESDRAKCCKNLGAAYWRLTKLGFDLVEVSSIVSPDDKHLIFNVLPSARNFLAAVEHGSKHPRQSREWLENIQLSLQDMATSVVERMRDLGLLGSAYNVPLAYRLSLSCKFNSLLADLCQVFSSQVAVNCKSQASAILHRALAEHFLEQGASLLKTESWEGDPGDYKACLVLMADCYQPLKVAEAHARWDEVEFVEDVKALRSKVASQQLLCESIQARVAGDKFLTEALAVDTDTLKRKNLAYLALDKYKVAASLAKGVDVEAEALALCCVGNVYSSALKMEKNALPYYENSLDLVKRNPNLQLKGEWYRRARSALQRLKRLFNPPRVHEEVASQDKQMRQAYEEVKNVIKQLETEAKNLGPAEFLAYVYKAHPPRRPDAIDLQLGNDNTRNAFRRALTAYHPDHNNADDDRKWRVICQEITKNLLIKYKILK